MIGAVGAVVVVVMILGGVAAYLALNRHQPAPPAKTQTGTAATQQPADTTPAPVADDGASAETSAPAATGGDASDGSAQSSTTGAGGLNLDDFVGTWEFVGNPGPWGEGWSFRLWRVGNLIIGEVEVPEMYDECENVGLKMAAGNGELTGESTAVTNGGFSDNHAVVMTLSDSKTVMTLKYRGEGGEWITHVAEKKSGASGGGATSSAVPSAQGDGVRSLVVAMTRLHPPADQLQVETSGDWVSADAAATPPAARSACRTLHGRAQLRRAT